MTVTEIPAIPAIDADSHLTEPPDLWESRLPKQFVERGPRVEFDETFQVPRWRLGDNWLFPVGAFSHAGWKEFAPSIPGTFEEIQPSCWDARERLRWMDEHGIQAQVLYPNLVGFEGHALMSLGDPDLAFAIVQTYNDYLVEFASVAPERFVLISGVPFWDRDLAVKEMHRCAAMGHKGVVWAATMAKHGLPHWSDPYWDTFYATAQDLEFSINFHVGIGHTADEMDALANRVAGKPQDRAFRSELSAVAYMSNASTIAHLIMSGICDRFPRLNFVSVESGFGYIPFLLESLDWAWGNTRGPDPTPPNRLLPSEYFRRQIYTMFWFEKSTMKVVPDFADNVMFETDFPHKTSLAPGAGSVAASPRSYMSHVLDVLGEDVARKVLHDNAARVYRLA